MEKNYEFSQNGKKCLLKWLENIWNGKNNKQIKIYLNALANIVYTTFWVLDIFVKSLNFNIFFNLIFFKFCFEFNNIIFLFVCVVYVHTPLAFFMTDISSYIVAYFIKSGIRQDFCIY